MKGNDISQAKPSLPIRVLEIVLLAATYFITARIGQIFAIEPGNVTPVWIPSGIMLAATLIRGGRVWPGIFIGAFCGNTWAYFSGETSGELLSTLIAGVSNGTGDALCFTLGAHLIRRSTGTNFPFESSKNIALFVLYGAVLSSAISALFGATSLSLVNLISWSQYHEVLITWWVGDAVGVLLITPFILYWMMRKRIDNFGLEAILYTLTLLMVCAYSLGLLTLGNNFSLPLSVLITVVMWSIFRFGPHATYTSILLIGVISVSATAMEFGRFAAVDLNNSLIELQIFLSIISIASMVMHAVLHECDLAQMNLLEANTTLESKVKQRTEELEKLATTDPLTGVQNRRSIIDRLNHELKRASRHQVPFSVLMLDLDHFKTINDHLGHDFGDEVLSEACKVWANELRDIDFLGRLGGEEFIIILPRTNCDDAAVIAERVRISTVEKATLSAPENLTVTVSIGVTNSTAGDTVQSILKRVDSAMYKAKENGRNQVSPIAYTG